MRTSSLLFGGFALAVLASAPALAADIAAPVYKAPVIAPVSNWNGLYLGINGGYGWGSTAWNFTAPTARNQDHNTQGGLAGGTVGWNYQVSPQWLVGIEADYDWANLTGGTACPNPTFRCQTKISSLTTVRGRLGYLVSPNAMVFATGGWGWSRMTAETLFLLGAPIPPSGTPTNGQSQTANGWALGVGGEYAFAPNWTAKVEYLHVHLGSNTYNVDNGSQVNAKQYVNTFRAGINYRFNWGAWRL